MTTQAFVCPCGLVSSERDKGPPGWSDSCAHSAIICDPKSVITGKDGRAVYAHSTDGDLLIFAPPWELKRCLESKARSVLGDGFEKLAENGLAIVPTPPHRGGTLIPVPVLEHVALLEAAGVCGSLFRQFAARIDKPLSVMNISGVLEKLVTVVEALQEARNGRGTDALKESEDPDLEVDVLRSLLPPIISTVREATSRFPQNEAAVQAAALALLNAALIWLSANGASVAAFTPIAQRLLDRRVADGGADGIRDLLRAHVIRVRTARPVEPN